MVLKHFVKYSATSRHFNHTMAAPVTSVVQNRAELKITILGTKSQQSLHQSDYACSPTGGVTVTLEYSRYENNLWLKIALQKH
jgi:hypothetical protein